MQDPLGIDVRLSLGVEGQVRKPPHDPRAQAGESLFTLIAGRTACRALAQTREGFFQRVDEAQRDGCWRPGQMVLDCLVHITSRQLVKVVRIVDGPPPNLREPSDRYPHQLVLAHTLAKLA